MMGGGVQGVQGARGQGTGPSAANHSPNKATAGQGVYRAQSIRYAGYIGLGGGGGHRVRWARGTGCRRGEPDCKRPA